MKSWNLHISLSLSHSFWFSIFRRCCKSAVHKNIYTRRTNKGNCALEAGGKNDQNKTKRMKRQRFIGIDACPLCLFLSSHIKAFALNMKRIQEEKKNPQNSLMLSHFGNILSLSPSLLSLVSAFEIWANKWLFHALKYIAMKLNTVTW